MAAEPEVKQTSSQLARESSLFDTASFHEAMVKKKESNRSVVSLAQEPNAEPNSKRKPRIIYENSFHLEPARRFEAGRVRTILEEVLESHLREEKYEQKACRQLVKTLAEIIKGRVKDLGFERYKLVCMVHIGQLKEQGFRVGSRCCWDARRDTFASANFKNKSLFAVATVWAAYYE